MSRRLAFVIVVCFVVAVVVTIAMPWLQRDRASADEFVEAAQAIASETHRGDVVLVHPPWRDDVVSALRERVHFAPGVLVTEAWAPRHGAATPRLFVLLDDAFVLPASLEGRAHAVVARVAHVQARTFEAQAARASAAPPRRR